MLGLVTVPQCLTISDLPVGAPTNFMAGKLGGRKSKLFFEPHSVLPKPSHVGMLFVKIKDFLCSKDTFLFKDLCPPNWSILSLFSNCHGLADKIQAG